MVLKFPEICTLLTFLTTFARVIKAWSWLRIQETSKYFSKKWYPLCPFSGILFAARRKFSLLASLPRSNLGTRDKLAVHLSSSALGGCNSTQFCDLVCPHFLPALCRQFKLLISSRNPTLRLCWNRIRRHGFVLRWVLGGILKHENRFKQPSEPEFVIVCIGLQTSKVYRWFCKKARVETGLCPGGGIFASDVTQNGGVMEFSNCRSQGDGMGPQDHSEL